MPCHSFYERFHHVQHKIVRVALASNSELGCEPLHRQTKISSILEGLIEGKSQEKKVAEVFLKSYGSGASPAYQ